MARNEALSEEAFDESDFLLATATSAQRRFALVVAAVIFAIFAVTVTIGLTAPFARAEVRIDGFVPALTAVFFVNDLITATLLFGKFSIVRSRELLVLADGFLYTALLAIPFALTFPGAFSPTGLLGAGVQSSAWLYNFWHYGFPVLMVVYAILRGGRKKSLDSIRFAIIWNVAMVISLVFGLTWFATVGHEFLPSLMLDSIHPNPLARIVTLLNTLICVLALALLYVRRRSVLDLWIMVVMCVWITELALLDVLLFPRFTFGFYAGRGFSLLTSVVVLVVLLAQMTRLSGRLAHSNKSLQRSEQHQRLLIAELDHRVKNILMQIAAVATSTRKGCGSIDDFVRSLNGRIKSMATAHTLLSETGWRNVGLDTLICTELAPYRTDTNVEIRGVDVMLTPTETQALGKVLHELATNAAKYGALSIPSGQVSVSWHRKPNGNAATLIIEWHELGGPPVASKTQSSYGTTLIRSLIPHELGGTVDLVFATEGVNCKIEVPLEEA